MALEFMNQIYSSNRNVYMIDQSSLYMIDYAQRASVYYLIKSKVECCYKMNVQSYDIVWRKILLQKVTKVTAILHYNMSKITCFGLA